MTEYDQVEITRRSGWWSFILGVTRPKPARAVFLDTRSNFHPYECGGPAEGCIHCIGRRTPDHDPDTCALCHYEDIP